MKLNEYTHFVIFFNPVLMILGDYTHLELFFVLFLGDTRRVYSSSVIFLFHFLVILDEYTLLQLYFCFISWWYEMKLLILDFFVSFLDDTKWVYSSTFIFLFHLLVILEEYTHLKWFLVLLLGDTSWVYSRKKLKKLDGGGTGKRIKGEENSQNWFN